MAQEVYNITAANRSLSKEQSGRTKRYLISMGLRTACVLAAIVVPGWPKWIFIVGAVVLPYLAVVIANAGHENDEPGSVGVTPASLPSQSQAQSEFTRATGMSPDTPPIHVIQPTRAIGPSRSN